MPFAEDIMNAPEDRLHDRFSTENRHSSARIERPFRANSRPEQAQQTEQPYSMTSSAMSKNESDLNTIEAEVTLENCRALINQIIAGLSAFKTSNGSFVCCQ